MNFLVYRWMGLQPGGGGAYKRQFTVKTLVYGTFPSLNKILTVLVCNNSVDLLFVVAGGHISEKMNFIKSIIDRFVMGTNNTRVGVLAVGLLNNSTLPLDDLESLETLESFIESSSGQLPSVEQFLRPDVGKVG